MGVVVGSGGSGTCFLNEFVGAGGGGHGFDLYSVNVDEV